MPRMAGDADPPTRTVPQHHFDRLYADKPDPWDLASSWYERRKYALTIASLPREQYHSGLELGCAIGELTRLLAPRCDRLVAVDCADRAITQARRAVAQFSHVQVKRVTLPNDLPGGRYDLVIASEILYYFCAEDLGRMLRQLTAHLEQGGDIVAVHHRARDRCYGYDGYNVHYKLASHPRLTGLVHHEDEHFVLDVLRHG